MAKQYKSSASKKKTTTKIKTNSNKYAKLLSEDETSGIREEIIVSTSSSAARLATSDIPMGARVVLRDPDYFFTWMGEIGKQTDASESRKRYYFRGERSAEYKLIPSLLRNQKFENLQKKHRAKNPLDLQKKLLDRYKRYTQHLIHADHDYDAPIYDDFDTLCMAQHHGLPTLLLDWTLNPFIAAYFACSGVSSTLLREKLATVSNMREYWIRIWVMRLKQPDKRQDQTIHLEDRAQMAKWNHDLGSAGMRPDGPKIVVPLVFTRRIAAQVGRFVYCGYMTDQYDKGEVQSLTEFSIRHKKSMPWDTIYSLDVEFKISDDFFESTQKEIMGLFDRASRKTIMKESFVRKIDYVMKKLEFMGFHSGRLFPDLGGWAQYLSEGNL